MVGKETKIIKFLKKWLNKPFKLGKYDCFQMILDFYNIKFEEFEGINNENYKEIWKKDKNKAKEIYKKFIETHFIKIDKNKRLTGDLVVIDLKYFFTVGIYLGNGHYITFNENKGSYVSRIFTKDYSIYRYG